MDETSIDVETVNLQFGDALEFTVSAVVPLKALAAERDRIVDTLEEMRAIDAADTADRAVPTPSGLCRNYCPHLHRCFAGQQHVQKRFGVAALQKRLAEVLSLPQRTSARTDEGGWAAGGAPKSPR